MSSQSPMNISNLTPEQMKEITLNAYTKGLKSENMQARDLIEDIKQQIISAIRK